MKSLNDAILGTIGSVIDVLPDYASRQHAPSLARCAHTETNMATKNLVVYIWSLDTTLQTDSLDARKANLKTALETAYGDLPSRSDGISPSFASSSCAAG